MDLNLETAFDEPVDLSHEFEIPSGRLERPELLSLSSGLVHRAPREGRASASSWMDASRFRAWSACARCLAPVPFVRKEEVSWTFMPAHEKPRGEADKLRAEKPKAAKPAGKAAKAGKGAEKDDEDGDELSAADLDVLYYDDFVVPFDPSSRSSCSSSCR
jgi:hypothetical protein